MKTKLECVDSFFREVSLLRNEIATMKRPDFPFLIAAKTGFLRTRNESNESASGIKKRKTDHLAIDTTQRKQRPSRELKTATNTNTSVILVVKRPPKSRHNYVGRFSPHISVTETEEYCETNGIELFHIRQLSREELQLKSFLCLLSLKTESSVTGISA